MIRNNRIKKYFIFNEHNYACFNLNCKFKYIDLNESAVKEGREYVHLLFIVCWTDWSQ